MIKHIFIFNHIKDVRSTLFVVSLAIDNIQVKIIRPIAQSQRVETVCPHYSWDFLDQQLLINIIIESPTGLLSLNIMGVKTSVKKKVVFNLILK